MPIKPRRRQSDLMRALVLMVEDQADDDFRGRPFHRGQSEFETLASTTWRELVERGHIEERGEKPGPSYRLTPKGWLEGMEASGALERDDVRQRALAIKKNLSARIKGRQHDDDARVDIHDLAAELALPVGWLLSALRADLLQRMFRGARMNATVGANLVVRIPQTFGSPAADYPENR